MANNGNDVTLIDGSIDFSGGVNSNCVTTVASERNPNGLKRNQVAWMNNCTVRTGGIMQRTGWLLMGNMPAASLGLYQGKFVYAPDFKRPYFIYVVDGNVWKADPDDPGNAVNLSALFPGMTMNPTAERVYFCQAEKFLIIGDGFVLPLFWDDVTLRRSIGLNPAATPGMPGVSEIPIATAMDYYMGRLWYAQGLTYSASDIVGGPSGTVANNFRDAVLNVTENPLCLGGDGFSVPTHSGNIRALRHSANLNVQLGEGRLYVFTRKEVYAMTVPVTRTDWIAADTNNMPLQVVAQINNGAVNDRSVVVVNGDLFYQALEPSIRSLLVSVRNFEQWGNTPISINEIRILQFNDRALLRFGSGIEFDNRMIQTALPFETPYGTAHKALIPLNFDVISTLETKLPPVWEGMYEGLNIMEMANIDFGGRERAFITSWSEQENCFQIWEMTDYSRWEKQDDRVNWYIEFPAFTWGDEFMMKKLVGCELWIDKLLGTVYFQMDYKVDGDPCWYPWHKWQACTAKNTCEDVNNPDGCVYPTPLRESYRQTITLPKPPVVCEQVMGRPSYIGYQFQPRLTIKGWCRIRGILLRAEKVESKLYSNMVCT